jgi:hypothetical protein
MEKAIYIWGLLANGIRWSANGIRWSANGIRWSANGRRWSANGICWSANGRRWSAPPTTRPFIPARKSGAFWLFHVTHRGIAKLRLDSKKGTTRTPEHCQEIDVLCSAVSTENGMYYSLLKQFLLSTKNNEEGHFLNDFTGKVWKC